MPTIDPDATYATFINTFRCQPADQDRVVQLNIEIIENLAVHQPGFISATVHRSLDGTRVVNYLQWQTAQHLAAMQRSPAFQRIAQQLSGLIEFDPHQCEVIHTAERA